MHSDFRSAFLLLGIGIIFSGLLLLCERGYITYLRPRLLKATADSPSRLNWCSLFSVSVSNSLKVGAVEGSARARHGDGEEGGEEDGPPEDGVGALGSAACDGGRCCGNAGCQDSVESAARELRAARRRIAALEYQLAANSKATMSTSYSAPLTVDADTGDAAIGGRVQTPPSAPGFHRATTAQPRCRRHHKTAAAAALYAENSHRHVVAARQNVRDFETVL